MLDTVYTVRYSTVQYSVQYMFDGGRNVFNV